MEDDLVHIQLVLDARERELRRQAAYIASAVLAGVSRANNKENDRFYTETVNRLIDE